MLDQKRKITCHTVTASRTLRFGHTIYTSSAHAARNMVTPTRLTTRKALWIVSGLIALGSILSLAQEHPVSSLKDVRRARSQLFETFPCISRSQRRLRCLNRQRF